MQLARDQASSYYKRVEEQFPDSADADNAHWRVTWTAVLKRDPDGAKLLQEHLRRFPGSQFTPDALYWLGRLAEEAKTPAVARDYYRKLAQRYPQNYFEILASKRLRTLGPGPVQVSDAEVSNLLATIPPVSAAPKLDGTIPPGAAKLKARADALRSIAFDASAELELRAGICRQRIGPPSAGSRTRSRRGEAIRPGDRRRATVIPPTGWPACFSPAPRCVDGGVCPALEDLDPTLVVGPKRPGSHAGRRTDPPGVGLSNGCHFGQNALGLMQLLPSTARRMARQSRFIFGKAPLRSGLQYAGLGRLYFAGLQKQFGSVEAALAAYNAGEDRVIGMDGRASPTARRPNSWTRFRSPRRASTSKSSSRNAEIYRRLYGDKNESRKPSPPQATATRPMLSAKPAQFTESVIREMTRLALHHGAVNLSQGFPDFPAPAELKRAAQDAIAADMNQYSITWGIEISPQGYRRQFRAHPRHVASIPKGK